MYESFYGLREKPFTLLPDPDYLYLSPKHQRALTLLEYGMMNHAGFSVICGDTGAGKTTLIRRLLVELGDEIRVGLITNTHHSFGELLNWVLMAFGLDGDGKSKSQMHQMFIEFLIEQYAQNKHTVLIVDEAQNMGADTLEELRMLSNINADKDQLLQVILAGQPTLRETLRKPELMQFAQRIAVDYYLESLSAEETSEYIHHRLGVAGAQKSIFTDGACKAVFKYSGGTPRLINLLCDTSLVYGFAEQSEIIEAQLVHDVVREQHSNSIIPTFNSVQPVVGDKATPEFVNAEPVVDQSKKVTEQNVNHDKVEEKRYAPEQSVERLLSQSKEENDELLAKMTQQVVQQSMGASTVNSVEQLASVTHTKIQSGVERAKIKSVTSENLKDRPEDIKDDSNVTPIKIKKPDVNMDVEVNAGVEVNTGVEKEMQMPENNEALKPEVAPGPEDAMQIAEKLQAEKLRAEDVYPIVHIEENPKKGFNMVLLGLVGGMFVASIMMMVTAWMMYGANDKNNQQLAQQNKNQQIQRDVENRELKALQKERDAAIAVTRALERERDAALNAARVQEEIRAAELRAAELIASQQQLTEKRLQQLRARTKEAELAESRALERERKLQQKAQKREAELEEKRLILHRKEQMRLEALTIETEMLNKRLQAEQSVVAEVVDIEPEVKVKEKTREDNKEKARKSFSANPCNSPSAKFLSTCKK